jgi:hypothetical protein
MGEVRQFKVGDMVRHFKNELHPGTNKYCYRIVAFAHHSETGEPLVVYRGMFNPYDVQARPYDIFMSRVDKRKYPEIKQTYRFELL